MITYEDAYQSLAKYAWLVLKRYKLPVTLFVPTPFPDQLEEIISWDRLVHAIINTTRRDKLVTRVGLLSLKLKTKLKETDKRLRGCVTTLSQTIVIARKYAI